MRWFFLLLLLPLGVQADSRPNILLLMAEDMSSRVGAFGDAVAVTPNLDQLAGQGVRYTNTFTTASVCAPSRAAHILGMHQISTGSQHMRSSSRPDGAYASVPPAEVKAYPELLRAAGYYTYTDRKMDYQFVGGVFDSGPFTIWDSAGESQPDWREREEGQPFFGFRNFAVTHESGVFTPLGSMPNSVTHFIMQFIRWWTQDEPIAEVVRQEDVQLPPYYPDTSVVRSDLARHYNNIAFMDGEVGVILTQLEADGLADSTIVIWTTDHGDGLPRAKRELYDSGIKVPMIIRWPERFRPEGIQAGAIDSRLISFIDLAPTILRLAGVEEPDWLQGEDFANDESEAQKYVFASRDRIDEVPDRQRAIRDEYFKYIRTWHPELPMGHRLAFRDNLAMTRDMRARFEAGQLNTEQARWFEPFGEEQLFDIKADPYELNNLASDPDYEPALQRMRSAMDAQLASIEDWSDESEASMVTRFQSDGEQRVTAAPRLQLKAGSVELRAVTPGSSLGYRVDNGPWQLYVNPIEFAVGSIVEAKAVRYGWQESEISTLSP